MSGQLPENVDVELVAIDDEELALITFPALACHADLSQAEREILGFLERGMSNAAIAAARGKSVHTVANQVTTLLRKFGVSSRHQLLLEIPK